MKYVKNEICETRFEQKMRESLRNWLNEYSFQYFVSIHYHFKNIEGIEKYLKSWRKKICIDNNIEDVCYLGVVVPSQFYPHIHLLLNTKNNRPIIKPQVKTKEEETEEERKKHVRVKIRPINSQPGNVEYLTLPKNTPTDFHLLSYNNELLNLYRNQY